MKSKKTLISLHLPRWNDLPEMDLYMDQVVTLLNSYLKAFCTPQQGKVITSTMINNYVKHGIVSAPVRKKYTRRHMAYLIVVCILKSVYRMDEISKLIKVQVDQYPQDQAYDYFCAELESCISCIFSQKKIHHIPSDDEGSEIVSLIQNTIQSVAYTVYVREMQMNRTYLNADIVNEA